MRSVSIKTPARVLFLAQANCTSRVRRELRVQLTLHRNRSRLARSFLHSERDVHYAQRSL